nr:GNAT family N-acetyltransferase [Qipengyuania qiaonensis]
MAGVPIPPTTSAEDHARLIARGRSLVSVVDGVVVGFAEAAPIGRDLHLHELSVSMRHQGRGIGATLLEALAIDARNAGYRAITLSTFRDVPWNAPFYARRGFVEIDGCEDYPHLSESLESAVVFGIPKDRRIAMIRFLD